MRGNPRAFSTSLQHTGSIPAHAGEPKYRLLNSSSWKGLSPRMRGNPCSTPPRCVRARSIPAHAGEPCTGVGQPRKYRVYPRACGGTYGLQGTGDQRGGSIPAHAGEPAGRPGLRKRSIRGSIPAHAGEPVPTRRKAGPPTVYPRACGGTGKIQPEPAQQEGLSPRMRGNHWVIDCNKQKYGSIPAHAGEPHGGTGWLPPQRVYPRACGGTVGCARIPRRLAVYPRACGGTGSPSVMWK